MENNNQINESKANILSQSLNIIESGGKSSTKLSIEDIDVKNEIIKENIEGESSGDEDDAAVKEFAKKRKALFAQKNKDKVILFKKNLIIIESGGEFFNNEKSETKICEFLSQTREPDVSPRSKHELSYLYI